MHGDQLTYRLLFDDLLDHEGDDPLTKLIFPWLAGADAERRWLASFAAREGDPIPDAAVEDLWRLYALSRVVDLLLMPFAPAGGRDGHWNVPRGLRLARGAYTVFMDELGFAEVPPRSFSPFFHEIVEVEQAEAPDEPISVVGEPVWPGWMLGPMMFARAGVRVRGGSDHVVKEVAERSRMYWTFARVHRPTADLSMGWGSNSQWRTSFRRDYLLGGVVHYNVDVDPADPRDRLAEDGLLRTQADELVRHRGFVTCLAPDADLRPYGYALAEPL